MTTFNDAGVAPRSITAGSDGNLFYVTGQRVSGFPVSQWLGSSVDRVTPSGAITPFASPLGPRGAASGPGGDLWFTSSEGTDAANPMLPVTPAAITRRNPGTGATAVTLLDGRPDPGAITRGPDGRMWFTLGAGAIGAITTAGVVQTYTDARLALGDESSIVSGPDGALWFTNSDADSIGRVTPTGAFSFFADPTVSDPRTIALGPDGNLWFTNFGNDTIGRITMQGHVTNYTGTGISQPRGSRPDPTVGCGSPTTGTIPSDGSRRWYRTRRRWRSRRTARQ